MGEPAFAYEASMGLDMIELIVSEVYNKRPKIIIECGAGISTLCIAHYLNFLERGFLYSLEDNKEYAESVKSLLDSHQLSDRAEVLYAPLTKEE